MVQESTRVEKPPRSLARRVLVGTAKLLVLLVVFYYVGRALIRQLGEIDFRSMHFDGWYICLAVVSIIIGRIAVGLAYRFMLGRLGSSVSVASVMAMVWIPQLGKYVPGKLASLLGVVWMMGRQGVSAARATKIACVITALSSILAVIMAVPLTLSGPIHNRVPLGWLWSILLVAAGLVALHPWVLNLLLHVPMKKMGFGADDQPMRVSDYGWPTFFLLVNWLLLGLSAWLTTRAVTDAPVSWIPLMVSVSALAVTVGFFALFAPSGLGVREGIMLIVLSPVMGNLAAVVTVATRVLFLVVDVVLAGAGVLILRFSACRAGAEGASD